MRWAYRRLKTSREANLTNHVGFVYVYVKQAKTLRKVATSRKSKTHIIDSEKQDFFQFVSV